MDNRLGFFLGQLLALFHLPEVIFYWPCPHKPLPPLLMILIILLTTPHKPLPPLPVYSTHLKWSCRATLKSKASPRSSNPSPTNACLPASRWWCCLVSKLGVATGQTWWILESENEIPAGVWYWFHSHTWMTVHRTQGKELTYSNSKAGW